MSGFVVSFFKDGRYFATGSYFSSGIASGRPLQWRFTARRSGPMLSLDGEYYALSGALKRQFQLEIGFHPEEFGRGTFSLRAEFPGEFQGAFAEFAEGGEYSAHALRGSGSLSMRVASSGHSALLAQGLLAMPHTHAIAFEVRIFSGDATVGAENVVGLRARTAS